MHFPLASPILLRSTNLELLPRRGTIKDSTNEARTDEFSCLLPQGRASHAIHRAWRVELSNLLKIEHYPCLILYS